MPKDINNNETTKKTYYSSISFHFKMGAVFDAKLPNGKQNFHRPHLFPS